MAYMDSGFKNSLPFTTEMNRYFEETDIPE